MHEWDSGGTPYTLQRNRILDAVVTILKYNKSTIDHNIFIKFLYDGTVSNITVSSDNVINTNDNETAFPELRSFFRTLRDESTKRIYPKVPKFPNFPVSPWCQC